MFQPILKTAKLGYLLSNRSPDGRATLPVGCDFIHFVQLRHKLLNETVCQRGHMPQELAWTHFAPMGLGAASFSNVLAAE